MCSRLVIQTIPANINLFKVSNRNSRKRFKVCPKVTIKTRSGVFIVNFELFHTSVFNVDFEQVNVCWDRTISAEIHVVINNFEQAFTCWALDLLRNHFSNILAISFHIVRELCK